MNRSQPTEIFNLQTRTVRTIGLLAFLAIFAAILFSAFRLESLPGLSGTASGDFDIFYTVARLALQGRLAEAYDLASFQQAQIDLEQTVHRMTWTYPPPYNLFLAPLGVFGREFAYLVFTAISLGAMLLVLRQLSGQYLGLVLFAALPPILISLRTGQNGCLTAALAGIVCLFLLRGKDGWSGLFLGVLVIKPHIGLGLGIWCLFSTRIKALGAAALTILALSAVTTLAFGAGIWGIFLAATHEASTFLREGSYPAFRMSSVYGSLVSFDVSFDTAFLVQGATALLGLAAIVFVARKSDLRSGLAAAMFITPVFTPYFFDYDLALYAPAFGLLLPLLDTPGRRIFLLPMVGLAWVAGGTGLVQNTLGAAEGSIGGATVAGMAAGLLSLLVLVALHRPSKQGAAS